MKLWISAEIDADVDDKHQTARKLALEKVNENLVSHKFTSPWISWDFISIIMSERDFYKEVAKKSKRDNSLEFRLKIDHEEFLKATQKKANLMLLEALERSVDKMSNMDVTEEDIKFLNSVLTKVKSEV